MLIVCSCENFQISGDTRGPTSSLLQFIAAGKEAAYPKLDTHKAGFLILKKFAGEYRRTDLLSMDGLLVSNGGPGAKVAHDFACYLSGTEKPSRLAALWAGAWAKSLRVGPLQNGTLLDGRKVITRVARTHIPTPKTPPSPELYYRFKVDLSEEIFGEKESRKKPEALDVYAVLFYIIFGTTDEGHKRLAEMLPRNESRHKGLDIDFIFNEYFVSDPEYPSLLCLDAPTKQNRQRGSNQREKVHFRSEFEWNEDVVSLAQAVALFKIRARELKIDLDKPIKIPSPTGCRSGNATRRKYRSWIIDLGNRLGFNEAEIKKFRPSLFRKCAMSKVTDNCEGNLFLSAQTTRHADVKTTNKYYQVYKPERLANFRHKVAASAPPEYLDVQRSAPSKPRRSERIRKKISKNKRRILPWNFTSRVFYAATD